MAMQKIDLGWRECLRIVVGPFGLSLITTWLCRVAAGDSLGFYLGPIAVISLMLPPLVAARRDLLQSLLIAGATVDGVAVAWLIAVFAGETNFLQWLGACLILAAYTAAMCAGVRVLMRWIAPLAGAAIVTSIGLLWLSWPVWLAPRLTDSLAGRLVPGNPLFALNRIFIDRGIWTQQRLMYQLTTLGQDVSYALPTSIWPSVMAHLLMAMSLWWLASRAPSPVLSP